MVGDPPEMNKTSLPKGHRQTNVNYVNILYIELFY